ncbi:ubiquinol-cytochrome c reductase iron-sulfur subunit [Spirosoma sp. KNUC1025]|uniref:QcrA and Rieske domain-containing protein n=1 Tax=Spirosoma sp. KNUC1025 TaxID=2894082 RepID=UPI00386AD808|nr:Rieske 2Fe-2S domain-containing protein [Spirosoma sp. KNUC1025]
METSNNSLDRRAFFSLVGTSVGAIILTQCLSGCSAPADTVTPSGSTEGGTNTGGKINLVLNLNESANTKLKQNGGFIYQNGLIIARTKDGGFLAVAQACTHQGTSVQYDATSNRLHCPDHGSNFKNDGSVINGPATSPLKAFKVSFDANTNILKVTE